MKKWFLPLACFVLLITACDPGIYQSGIPAGTYVNTDASITLVLEEGSFVFTHMNTFDNTLRRKYEGTFDTLESIGHNGFEAKLITFSGYNDWTVHDASLAQLRLTWNSPVMRIEIDTNADGSFAHSIMDIFQDLSKK